MTHSHDAPRPRAQDGRSRPGDPEDADPSCDPLRNLSGRSPLARLADFLFEAGMLRKTPRSGYQFLGSGRESVAEHSFRAALIGYALARAAGLNAEHTAMLCLIHDFHEARTGDFNYVNSMYNSSRQRLAMEHALHGTDLADSLLPLWDEQDAGQTREALLAKDADHLDLMLNLVEERNLGNPYAGKWLETAEKRIVTEEGRELARQILNADHTDWWFKGPDADWWVRKNGK
jgi:putative hydrolase of HD superfamily